jgi:hypothetical protein
MSVVDVLFRRDPVALVGILISVVLSVALDVTNVASGVESLLAALGGTTLALVLDSLVRAERRFELRRVLDVAPWFGEAVRPLAESTRQIEQLYPRSLITTETRERFEQLHVELDGLTRGRIERDGTDYRYLIEPSSRARYRIDAVTNIVPESGRLAWWEDDIGRHYWRTNLDALARGVRIRRIFTYLDMTPELEQLIEEQRAAGVETMALPRATVSEALQMNLVIWDSVHAWEARLNARGAIVANIYTVNQHDVARLQAGFERLTMSGTRAVR